LISKRIDTKENGMAYTAESSVKVFKALGDPSRLRVLEALQTGEKCACELLELLSVGQPTLSHHMGVLVAAGLVSARRAGKWTFYSLCRAGCERAMQAAARYLTVSAGSQTRTGCCEEE
jgi:ArsR family transcriptional regulator